MQEVKLHLDQRADFHTKEAYKTLRSNVEFCGGDVKIIAVTSCTPHEGKTSVAMELARSFAEAGHRALLIDADMRKSVLVSRYKTGAVKYGLSHCLIGKYKYTDAMSSRFNSTTMGDSQSSGRDASSTSIFFFRSS